MPRPLPTDIVPSYNAERFIAESLESVLAHTVEHSEFNGVDNGSTDSMGCYFRLSTARRTYPAGTRGDQPQASSHTRNLGLGKANGDLIAVIDSEDP